MALAAVPCLAVSVRIRRVWERSLIAVHSLAVDANTLIDCPTVFRKVPTDWVRVCTESVWEANLVGVHCLEAWAWSEMGWDRLLSIVHCLAIEVNTPSDSWTDLRKVVNDWLMALTTTDSVGSLTDMTCLDTLARTSRLSESILVTVHCRDASARIPRDVSTDFRKVPAD